VPWIRSDFVSRSTSVQRKPAASPCRRPRASAIATVHNSVAALPPPKSAAPQQPRESGSLTAESEVSLRRVDDMWEVGYRGRTAYLRDVKGLHDLASLPARPSVELAAIDLAGAAGGQYRPDVSEPTLHHAALAACRRRLTELADDLAAAEHNDDIGRAGQARDEREWIIAELRRPGREGPLERLVSRRPSALARLSPPASATQSAASPRSCQTLVPTLTVGP
jgi:hypothetical protein